MYSLGKKRKGSELLTSRKTKFTKRDLKRINEKFGTLNHM